MLAAARLARRAARRACPGTTFHATYHGGSNATCCEIGSVYDAGGWSDYDRFQSYRVPPIATTGNNQGLLAATGNGGL